MGGEAERLAPLRKFHHVQAALASFHFGHEGLGVPNALGQRTLGDTRLLPQLHEQGQKGAVVTVVG